MRVITLLTDFGLDDWFVGTMKGVILERQPGAQIVDVSHGIPPGAIRAGAFALMAACRFFPKQSVHVAVVDPGVGGQRAAVAVQTRTCFLVGPDNGVLSWALRGEEVVAAHRIENPRLGLKTVSRTFHGRDVFAPAAAYLASGGRIHRLGPSVDTLAALPWPEPERTRLGWRGEVLYVDRFGNLITNLPETLAAGVSAPLNVHSGRRTFPVASHYGAVERGRPVAVFGSTGYLEVAICDGNASQTLRLGEGSLIELLIGS